MTERVTFTTGVGRLVQGSVFEPQTTDAEGNPLTVKSGPNAGQPRQDFYFAIAIDKNDPSCTNMFQKMQQAAQQDFPRGEWQGARFAWKYIDGDGVDANGQPYSQRPGFAGCFVFKFSGGYAPKCYQRGSDGRLQEITDRSAIKRGYYVQVNGSVAGNASTQQPGIFLNHSLVLLAGYGEEIVSGPDPDEAFGNQPANLPPGASTTPPAATPSSAAGPAAGGPQPGAAAGPAAGGPQPGAQPAQGVEPAHDMLDPGAAPAAAAPVVKRYDANGNAFTEDQLRQAGWTEAQIQAAPLAQ